MSLLPLVALTRGLAETLPEKNILPIQSRVNRIKSAPISVLMPPLTELEVYRSIGSCFDNDAARSSVAGHASSCHEQRLPLISVSVRTHLLLTLKAKHAR